MRIIDLSKPFSLEEYRSDRHHGTHIDSPAYLSREGRKIGAFELKRFFCDGVILDLTHKKPGEPIDDEDLEAAEESAGLALREEEAVVLHTGVGDSSQFGERNIFLSQNGAEYLEFKGVSLVGIDSEALDDAEESGLSAHRVLLGKDILVLEGLCSLGAIDSSRFKLASFPLNSNAAVSPVRAVAILD